MTYPGVLFWIFAIWAMRSRGPGLYYLFFFSWSLGTLAVIPPQLAGGNFTPAWVVAGFLTLRVLQDVGVERYGRALLDIRRFGLLSLSTLYAVASAVFLPRLFEGKVNVVEMRLIKTADPVPLEPGLANFNQTLYVVLSALIVVNTYFICTDPAKRRDYLKAFGWGAVVAIITGLTDLVASRAGLGSLLAPFRNAAYVMMLDNDAMNMHRIVGLMSEASSYASLCLPFLSLILLAPADAGTPWGRWSRPLGIALFVMTYLSTSSSGYVSLGAAASALMLSLFIGVTVGRRAAWLGAYGVLAAVTVILGAALVTPEILTSFYHIIDAMVLHKTQSDSYVQRQAWNHAAIQAFFGTYGLGAGAGSARASSWPISLLANIGAPGTALLASFILQVLFAKAAAGPERLLARAAKLALWPNVLMLSLSGTSMAFGAGVATLLGLISGLAWEDEGLVAASRARLAAARSGPREMIAGIFVDQPIHAIFLSTNRRVILAREDPVRSRIKAVGSRPGAFFSLPGVLLAQRDRAFRRFVERLDRQIPPGRFMHVMIYAPPGEPPPAMDRWIARNPHWTYELDSQSQLVTADWLDGVARYVAARARIHRNEGEQLAHLRALIETCKRAGAGPVRLRWIARVDSEPAAPAAAPVWAEGPVTAGPGAS